VLPFCSVFGYSVAPGYVADIVAAEGDPLADIEGPSATGIDIYIGVGGAPEGVLAAAALACIGGQIEGRLVLDTEEKRSRAAKMGIKEPRKKYRMEDMVRGDCVFAATGVTTGSLLKGVRFRPGLIETDTVVMRSATGTVRWIRAEHRKLAKFHLD